MDTTFYYENDPSTPELNETIQLPKFSTPLKINVNNFKEGVVSSPEDEQYHHAACYVTLTNAVNRMQEQLAGIHSMVPYWAARNLTAYPLAGEMWNAYYDRNSLRYFYATNPATNKRVCLVDSSDIVTHELGHAFLDAMRPDFWSMPAIEIRAFHEAFADIVAVVSITNSRGVVKKAIEDTNGNLMQSNVMSRLAEQVGSIMHEISGHRTGFPNCLRDASKVFLYKNPSSLPSAATDASTLINECHSFGQVFLGAWYEVMVSIFNFYQKSKNDPINSLVAARNVAFRYLLESVKTAPRCTLMTKAIAEGMITSAKRHNEGLADLVQQVFIYRNIIDANSFVLRSAKSPKHFDQIKDFMREKDEEFSHEKGNIIRYNRTRTVKLSEYRMMASLNNNNPFLSAEIEVPNDSLFEFDENGLLVREIQPDENDIIQNTIEAAGAIWNEDNRKEEKREERAWHVKYGKVVRKLIY